MNCFSHRSSNSRTWSYLDPWRQWQPSLPPCEGQRSPGAHHGRGEERGPHQSLCQERGGTLPHQQWQEDPKRPGGGVQ